MVKVEETGYQLVFTSRGMDKESLNELDEIFGLINEGRLVNSGYTGTSIFTLDYKVSFS